MADRLPSRPPRTNWGNLSKNLALWLLVGLLALALFQMMSRQRNPTQEFSYTEFSRQLDQGNIARVEIFDGKRLEGDFKNPRHPGQPDREELPGPAAGGEQRGVHQAAGGCRGADHRQGAQGRDHRDHHRRAPLDRDPRPVVLPAAPAPGRRQPRVRVREVQGQAPRGRHAQGHLCRRGRRRRGQGRAAGDHRVPEGPAEVHPAGRAAAQGRPAGGPPGHGQDAAGQGRGRRGRPPVLLDVGLRLRRDVRRRRRQPRAGPLRAGQVARALYHLHRRDRCRGPAPRRRTRRRA